MTHHGDSRGGEARMKRAARIKRRNRIALAYVVALGDDLIPYRQSGLLVPCAR